MEVCSCFIVLVHLSCVTCVPCATMTWGGGAIARYAMQWFVYEGDWHLCHLCRPCHHDMEGGGGGRWHGTQCNGSCTRVLRWKTEAIDGGLVFGRGAAAAAKHQRNHSRQHPMQRHSDYTTNYQLQQTGTRVTAGPKWKRGYPSTPGVTRGCTVQKKKDPNGMAPTTPDWTMHPKSAWAILVLAPPLCIATPKYQINTVRSPTAAWTRTEAPRLKKRRLHGELGQERGR